MRTVEARVSQHLIICGQVFAARVLPLPPDFDVCILQNLPVLKLFNVLVVVDCMDKVL